MPSLIPDAGAFRGDLQPCRGETPSRRNCTGRRFKDGKAAFPQEWRRGGRQGWRKDRQRVGTGLVFGEQAALLDQPHTADVRTLEQSEFYVADASDACWRSNRRPLRSGDPRATT